MPKPPRRRPAPAATPTPQPVATSNQSPRRFGEAEFVAILAAALCALLAWLSRSTLNPDGVSYLDLSNRLIAGDWSSFVQGYWSPLYPAVVALLSTVTSRDPMAMMTTAHVINGVAAILGVALLWWWSRRAASPFFARVAIGTFLLISAGLPRIEAVTPDVLLLALMTWLAYELLVHRGARWIVVGIILGTTFLVKTSAWPWLLLAFPIRFWAARDRESRRQVLQSSAICAAVMLTWVIPMSTKGGHVTLGSAGRLNACWYLEACDSRTPDTHIGAHLAYHQKVVGSNVTMTWAEFAQGDRWTYAPWSDPTAWEAGVRTRTSHTPALWDLLLYWGRLTRNTLGLWLLPVLLGVLMPGYVMQRRPGMWRSLLNDDRHILGAALLGMAGVGQFILVHSEPRLVAPFGMLFALAALHWIWNCGEGNHRVPAAARQVVTALGLIGSIGFGIPRLQEGFASSDRINSVVATIANNKAALARAGLSLDRIVIIGPAIPVEASAFLSGAHIVAQVPPASFEAVKSLPPAQQQAAILGVFSGKADIAWITTAEAGVTFVELPKQ